MRTGSGQRSGAPKLSAIDLNLLIAFEALHLERSVTRAGRRLGLSQPATSAALAKLRAVLPLPYADKLARTGRVRIAQLPRALARPSFAMRLAWPARLDPSRAWQWMRDQVAAAAKRAVSGG